MAGALRKTAVLALCSLAVVGSPVLAQEETEVPGDVALVYRH